MDEQASTTEAPLETDANVLEAFSRLKLALSDYKKGDELVEVARKEVSRRIAALEPLAIEFYNAQHAVDALLGKLDPFEVNTPSRQGVRCRPVTSEEREVWLTAYQVEREAFEGRGVTPQSVTPVSVALKAAEQAVLAFRAFAADPEKVEATNG